jgi:hypothetical protein
VAVMRFISLGAGVQSTAMALMAARGEIGPMPDAAVFADTGDEPEDVYRHLTWLMSPGVLPFPVHITSKGKLSEKIREGDKEARPPLFIKTKKGRGMLGRQCTRNYKVRPIRRKIRDLMGLSVRAFIAPGAVEMWIGISTDEVIRMKPSGLAYLVNRHPLIESRFSRVGCLSWLSGHGYPTPPKSSCVYCPFKSNAQWRQLRDGSPADWAAAVSFDHSMRLPHMVESYGVEGFVHSGLKPLDQADLEEKNADGFNHDCEGHCGV